MAEFNLTVVNLLSEDDALAISKIIHAAAPKDSYQISFINHQIRFKEINENVLLSVIEKLNKGGFKPIVEEVEFPVLNLSCASCAVSAQNQLSGIEGVLKATVNYANAKAYITFLPSMTDAKALKQSLLKIGYDIVIDQYQSKDYLIEYKLNQQRKLKLDAIGAMVFSLPLVWISMTMLHFKGVNYVMWMLATPVVFLFGKRYFTNAFKLLMNKKVGMDTLVALSTGVAYTASVFNTLFESYWLQKGMEVHLYFESSAVVITFLLIGKWLEEKAKDNTSFAIKKLMGLQSNEVYRKNAAGNFELSNITSIQIGDCLMSKPGEKIAVDGKVIQGHSYVDESSISGEPLPVLKQKDSMVYAGTINQDGSLEYLAEKVGADTLLARITQLVEKAQGSRAPVQQLTDKIATYFVPIVIAIASMSWLMWSLLGGTHGWDLGMRAFVTVLVIACPCALGLATPTAIIAGVGKGAENGILIKNAEGLEVANHIDTIVLDKTGTITQGKPEVVEQWTDSLNEVDAAVLYTMEHKSGHPLSKAIAACLSHNKEVSITAYQNITGKGIVACYESNQYYAGNKQLMDEQNCSIPDAFMDKGKTWMEAGHSLVYFAKNNNVIGLFAINDAVKTGSKEAIDELKQKGISVFMLSGDHHKAVERIAVEMGIANYTAHMLPEDKAVFIENLQKEGKKVAMVGDGINDSAALAKADLGIAMGKGSDIAIDIAHITLLSSDLKKLNQSIELSKQTVSIIQQNLFWAFIYNIIAIPIAAGLLYPVNGYLLDPMIAGALMALSSISVVTNSLRLRYINI